MSQRQAMFSYDKRNKIRKETKVLTPGRYMRYWTADGEDGIDRADDIKGYPLKIEEPALVV